MTPHYSPTIRYLGESGSTHECVYAMTTILTSPYPCQEITIVVNHREGDDFEGVCFVVWGWLNHDITIVPDGFGTHGGTGGWGLGLVLELIAFYGVTLREQWVDVDVFTRIVVGRPRKSDIATLRQADISAPSWPYWKSLFRRQSRTWSAFRDAHAQRFPIWLLEPELLAEAREAEIDPAAAAFRATKRLEVIIRELSGLDASVVGVDLVSKALGKAGPLALKADTESEKQAWESLFRGVIGAFKNPQSHRDEELSLEDATGQIFAVNTLLRKLKHDFPKHFEKQTSGVEDEPNDDEGDDG